MLELHMFLVTHIADGKALEQCISFKVNFRWCFEKEL